MDQFCAGLQMLGVLDMLRKYPEIMQPLFIQAGPRKKLDKGKGVLYAVWKVYNKFCAVV